jgi:jasmonate ZIM domain-containing protein
MSFKVAQEDKTKTIESDALVSSGFMSVLSADACDPGQKRSAAEIQVWYSFPFCFVLFLRG